MSNRAECRVVFPSAALANPSVRSALDHDLGVTEADLSLCPPCAPAVERECLSLLSHEVDGLIVATDEIAQAGELPTLESALRCAGFAYDAEQVGTTEWMPERRFWRPGMDGAGYLTLTHDRLPYIQYSEVQAILARTQSSRDGSDIRSAFAGLLSASRSESDPILNYATPALLVAPNVAAPTGLSV